MFFLFQMMQVAGKKNEFESWMTLAQQFTGYIKKEDYGPALDAAQKLQKRVEAAYPNADKRPDLVRELHELVSSASRDLKNYPIGFHRIYLDNMRKRFEEDPAQDIEAKIQEIVEYTPEHRAQVKKMQGDPMTPMARWGIYTRLAKSIQNNERKGRQSMRQKDAIELSRLLSEQYPEGKRPEVIHNALEVLRVLGLKEEPIGFHGLWKQDAEHLVRIISEVDEKLVPMLLKAKPMERENFVEVAPKKIVGAKAAEIRKVEAKDGTLIHRDEFESIMNEKTLAGFAKYRGKLSEGEFTALVHDAFERAYYAATSKPPRKVKESEDTKNARNTIYEEYEKSGLSPERQKEYLRLLTGRFLVEGTGTAMKDISKLGTTGILDQL